VDRRRASSKDNQPNWRSVWREHSTSTLALWTVSIADLMHRQVIRRGCTLSMSFLPASQLFYDGWNVQHARKVPGSTSERRKD